MKIIPGINGKYIAGNGEFQLHSPVSIDFGVFDKQCVTAFTEHTGLEFKKVSKQQADITLMKNMNLKPEGYQLDITTTGIKIEANTNQGILWAFVTLKELMVENKKVPVCQISDEPKYGHRGLSLDCARYFFDASEVKKIIKQMSLVKMNVLHWHLSDDQGWRIESKRYPLLTQGGEPYYTQEELKSLVEYANWHGIEVIPEIDMPGHSTAILAAYPDLSCSGKKVTLAKCGGIYPITLCPGKDPVYKMLEELLDEILDIFPGPRIHLGGDETPVKEWEKCECCKRKLKEEGLTSYRELQGFFTNHFTAFMKERGRQVICWNDSLEAGNLSKSQQIQYWSVQYADKLPEFLAKGGQMILSDMFELYFDYPHSMTSLKKVYQYKPVIEKVNYSQHKGVLGVEACIWAEHITDPMKLEKLLFPRLFAVAENAWSSNKDYTLFIKKLTMKLEQLQQKEVAFTSIKESNPKGKERRQQTIDYMKNLNKDMPEDIKAETLESAKPNKAFIRSFTTRFFKLSDLPFLVKYMK